MKPRAITTPLTDGGKFWMIDSHSCCMFVIDRDDVSRAYWGDVVDGLFSWEAAWPSFGGFGGNFPGDISPDVTVMNGARAHNKTYMIGVSPLQYKNAVSLFPSPTARSPRQRCLSSLILRDGIVWHQRLPCWRQQSAATYRFYT